MACNICRKEKGEHKPMVLVRCNNSVISKATEREPLCLIDYCVCDDCAKDWQKAFFRRQANPMAMMLIIAAICIVLGLTTRIGWGMYVAAAVPLTMFVLSAISMLRQVRRSEEDKVRIVFCDFFFQKGGIPKQIITRMPFNHAVKNVLVAASGPDTYMLMDLDEMDQYLTPEERKPARSWRQATENQQEK